MSVSKRYYIDVEQMSDGCTASVSFGNDVLASYVARDADPDVRGRKVALEEVLEKLKNYIRGMEVQQYASTHKLAQDEVQNITEDDVEDATEVLTS